MSIFSKRTSGRWGFVSVYVSVRNIVTWTSEIAFFMQFGTVNLFLNIQKVVECLQAFVYPFRTGKFSGMFFFKPSLPAIVSFSRYRLYKVFSTITKYLEFLLAFHLPVTDGKKFMEWFFQNFWHSCKYLFMCYGWTPVFFFIYIEITCTSGAIVSCWPLHFA